MKRAAELVALSREHHEALVLARRACSGSNPVAVREQVLDRWTRRIEPHIAVEERVLLPALAEAGGARAAADALRQHGRLRAYTDLLRAGDLGALPLWARDARTRAVRGARPVRARAGAAGPAAARRAACPAPGDLK